MGTQAGSARRAGSKWIRATLVVGLVAAVVCGGLSAARAGALKPVSRDVARALLRSDWEQVAQLLDSVTVESPVVLRMVKAHACLATNSNNESAWLLASVVSGADRQAWLDWTSALNQWYPTCPVSVYLRADALARQGAWEEAVATLDDGIGRWPAYALMLNSRGVVHGVQKEWSDARLDFDRAATAAPMMADVFANRAALCIKRREAPDAGVEDYDKALSLSPAFALALIGRGSLRMVLAQSEPAPQAAEEGWEAMLMDFESADKLLGDCPPVVVEQLRRNAAAAGAAMAQVQSISPELDRLGMSIFGGLVSGGIKTYSLQTKDMVRSSSTSYLNVGPIRAHMDIEHQQTRAGIQTRTDVGGVSTEQIAAASIETGDWPVDTLFGPLITADGAPAQAEGL